MKKVILSLGLAACVAGAAEAAYRRGDLLWTCDFTRAELPLVNGTNGYLREGRTWIANEGRNGDGAMRVKNARFACTYPERVRNLPRLRGVK